MHLRYKVYDRAVELSWKKPLLLGLKNFKNLKSHFLFFKVF